jgi:squalene-associated FAD-dependent desaturase
VTARAVVVGGGLAGITAALDLADTGAAVVLLEARPRLGGAAYSIERDGLVVDNGQHVFLRCCDQYRALLDRLGATDDTVLQERLDIPMRAPGRRGARLRRDGLPAPLHLSRSLLRLGLISVGDRTRVARAMLRLRAIDPDDPAADAQAFGAWLTAQRQSPAAIEALWRLITVATLNLEPRDASLAQAAYVFQTGLLRDAAAGDIGWSRVPLSQLHDRPARRALERAGVEVRVGARVQEIAAGDGGAGFEVRTADGPTDADAVVLAVQSQRVSGLLPAGAVADPSAPERLGSSPILNLHIHYDRRVLDEPFVAAVDSPVSWIFDRTASAGASDGQVLALSLSAADAIEHLDADALRARFLPALAQLLPAARDAQVQRFLVHREHHATFRAAPGSRALRCGAQTARPGFVLAGAWTDTGWPATMEGAVRSGHAAAAALGPVLAQPPVGAGTARAAAASRHGGATAAADGGAAAASRRLPTGVVE